MLKRHIKRATPSTSTARARARWGGLSLETQKGLPLKLASEDPAVDSGLKAVSILVRHIIVKVTVYNVLRAIILGKALFKDQILDP